MGNSNEKLDCRTEVENSTVSQGLACLTLNAVHLYSGVDSEVGKVGK